MLKNISFLALAGALAFATSLTGCVVVTDDGTTIAETGDGDGDGDSGDGDGDGDGDTGDGDGDTGDGDGDTGDGDGDTGDGDGDTGDGDGDAATCGWDAANSYYACGFDGEDPGMTVPYACPDGLVDGDPCGDVTGQGCCDANGDNWYCSVESTLVFDSCAD